MLAVAFAHHEVEGAENGRNVGNQVPRQKLRQDGKEIYEGDKLRDDYYDEDTVIEDYAVVVWDGKLCQWAIDNSFAQDGSSYTNLVEYFGRENLEIIGNVFENADLVKL